LVWSKLGFTVDKNWKKIIYSDETQVVIDQSKQVHVIVWRRDSYNYWNWRKY
jgi:hypothetical protein